MFSYFRTIPALLLLAVTISQPTTASEKSSSPKSTQSKKRKPIPISSQEKSCIQPQKNFNDLLILHQLPLDNVETIYEFLFHTNKRVLHHIGYTEQAQLLHGCSPKMWLISLILLKE
jgi:hypothetical protein